MGSSAQPVVRAPLSPDVITLPFRFDTSDVWHLIVKGAFGFNALLILCVIGAGIAHRWTAAIGIGVCEVVTVWFTRLFIKYQEGSSGVLTRDGVDVEPNVVLGVPLPGPTGRFELDRFSAIRVEFRIGPVRPGVQGGPNEVVWLVGRPGTPNVALARTDDGAGREVGRQLGALLELPVEEVGDPRFT